VMMIGMILEVEGLIGRIEKLHLQRSISQTTVTEQIHQEIEQQVERRGMVDQQDRLGVADQCPQRNIGTGAGMNQTRHQGRPEVQHVLRYLVISIPFSLHSFMFCCMTVAHGFWK
jgi:hypothetical protein